MIPFLEILQSRYDGIVNPPEINLGKMETSKFSYCATLINDGMQLYYFSKPHFYNGAIIVSQICIHWVSSSSSTSYLNPSSGDILKNNNRN